MQWDDFLIVVIISGKFILLVPGSHMFSNHYSIWFPATDERLLRKNTPSVQKLKVKRYLLFVSLLPQANMAEATSCPEAVPGIIYRLVFLVSLLRTHANLCSSSTYQPANAQQWHPFSPPELLPAGTRGAK